MFNFCFYSVGFITTMMLYMQGFQGMEGMAGNDGIAGLQVETSLFLYYSSKTYDIGHLVLCELILSQSSVSFSL